MNEDEITNLKIMICNLDLSVGTKEKLYNQAHKIRNEIERLNNIINELDNMFYETFRISQNGYYSISEWELKEFTDKIKELKGVDKE